MRLKLKTEGVFCWVEPKGVSKLRDLIQYGSNSFWDKLSYKEMFGYFLAFSLLFFPYYLIRLDDCTSIPKLLISAFVFAVSIIGVYVLFDYFASAINNDSVTIKKGSIFLHSGTNAKEIKWSKIRNVELISGFYQNKHFNILCIKENRKILKVVFIADIINTDYLIEYFKRIGLYITRLDLNEYMRKKEVKNDYQIEAVKFSKKVFKYPKEIWIGWLGLSFFGLILMLFVIFMGQGTIDEKNEQYFWYLSILITAVIFIFPLLVSNEFQQEILIENPYIIQKFRLLKGTKKFDLSGRLSFELKSGCIINLTNSKQKISIDSRLININDFCNELQRITNLHILKNMHEAQYNKMINEDSKA